MIDSRSDSASSSSASNKIEFPTLLSDRGRSDGPLPAAPSLSSALEAGNKALTLVDAYRTFRVLNSPEPVGVGEGIGVAFFLYSIAPDWAKPPFIYKYYEGGFQREIHLADLAFKTNPLMTGEYIYLRWMFGDLSKFDAAKLISGEDAAKLFNSLVAAVDKTQAYLDAARQLAESNWPGALLKGLELVVRGTEANKAAEDLGNAVPISGRESPSDVDTSSPDSIESDDGEFFRGNDPRENSLPIDQPGFDTDQEFDG